MKYFVRLKLSENISETPEGFLVCLNVPIARTGVMDYGEGETPLEVGSGGIVKISREEDEVFRPETIASFEGKPITITHPTEFVDPTNWSRLARGSVHNVRRGKGDQSDDLLADFLITDATAIQLVKAGLREVSCGYEAEYIQTGPGTGKQTRIVGNHVALVDEGRAGSAYAINDHKGKGTKMKLTKIVESIFSKAKDEAMKAAKDADMIESKNEKVDDADMIESKNEKVSDEQAYDELVETVKDLAKRMGDLGGMISSMAKPKDAAGEAQAGQGQVVKKEGEAADDDPMAALSDRLAALEACVQKLMEGKDADMSEGMEEMGDEEMEESEDDDFEESTMVGDTAARAEILAPGIRVTKDVKARALETAYKTADGKKAIDAFTGGKKPDFKDATKVDTLFIGASELLKVSRNKDLSKTKSGSGSETYDSTIFRPSLMTAEKMNEINAKHFKGAK